MKIISFETIEKGEDKLTNEQKSIFAFSNGITPIVLEEGDRLSRFYSSSGSMFSVFWVDHRTVKYTMEIIHSRGDYEKNTKKEIVKDALAVLNNWSNIDSKVNVKLKKKVIVNMGNIGSQKQQTEATKLSKILYANPTPSNLEYRIGGLKQDIIPYFKNISLAKAQDFFSVTHNATL